MSMHNTNVTDNDVSWAAVSYRLMVDTTDIDFEVTSSERPGI
jgi:hypothetical protein